MSKQVNEIDRQLSMLNEATSMVNYLDRLESIRKLATIESILIQNERMRNRMKNEQLVFNIRLFSALGISVGTILLFSRVHKNLDNIKRYVEKENEKSDQESPAQNSRSDIPTAGY